MIKKFTDESLDELFAKLSKSGMAPLSRGRYGLRLDTVSQLPDGAALEPAKNPEIGRSYTHLGTYKQFHVFVPSSPPETPPPPNLRVNR
ncbi:MAG: hypothetical protein ACRC62_20365 [Microcoleus sp.]